MTKDDLRDYIDCILWDQANVRTAWLSAWSTIGFYYTSISGQGDMNFKLKLMHTMSLRLI